ncbi:MAG: PEP-CTERM sorting domain-containing protein [Roseibacillus sp.]
MKTSLKFSQLSISIVLLVAASSGASAAVMELGTNGDFETGTTTGWSDFTFGTQTFGVVSDSFAGTSAGKVENGDSATPGIIKQANLGIGVVNPGDTITISFYAKGEGLNGGVQFAEFFSETAGGGVSKSEILGGAPLFANGTYALYEFTTTAGADVSGGVTLQFGATTGAAAGSFASLTVDNVSVSVDVIPEPSSTMLLALPLLGFVARRRR